MDKSTVKQGENLEIKTGEKPSDKKNVRMRKGSIIVNIEKRFAEDYKRQGFSEM